PRLLSQLRSVTDYDLAVCDTPPHLTSEGLNAIVQASDYVILPSPPATLDLKALIDTVKTAISPLQVPYRVLLTRVDPRQINDAMDAQSSLMEAQIPVFNSMIRAYTAHERASRTGVSIVQWKGKNAREAESDYRRVIDELQREVGNGN
ncbi:MAG: ParA family protein, partial [Microcystaceae cyanobacterium]